jgi:alkylation response protein AidB-like acyl-CoA dehydrogenase
VIAGGTGTAAFAADTVTARPDGNGWVLSGTAEHVIDGDRADEIAVVAASGDDQRGVFVVPAADVSSGRDGAFDGALHLAHVGFDDVRVPADRACTGPDVADGVARARQEALAGISAMTVGASHRILDLVLEHIKARKQFGVPIGSFQAVKHLAVDMLVAIERGRALAEFAALTIAEDDPRRGVAAAMAKTGAGDCQRLCVKHGIQLFGGLGFTWENDLQIFVRRAKAGELLLGSSTHHRALVARAAIADRIGRPTAVTSGEGAR